MRSYLFNGISALNSFMQLNIVSTIFPAYIIPIILHHI